LAFKSSDERKLIMSANREDSETSGGGASLVDEGRTASPAPAQESAATGAERPATAAQSESTADASAGGDTGEDSGGGESGESKTGDAADAKPPELPKVFFAAPQPPPVPPPTSNIKLSSGKNPATGEPWRPLERVIIGGDKIKMPPVSEQTAGPFFHERAAEIIANFGNYKVFKAKGE
jgi:hypothetical protein